MSEGVPSNNHFSLLCSRVTMAILVFVQLTMSDVSGQELWTSDQFLNLDQKTNVPYQENLNFLKNKAKGMPFVDRYEFRTETDEMEFEQQQYQFRFKFNSSDERKAYDKILVANADKYSWLQAQYELDVWEEKYSNIVDLYFVQKEMKLIREDLELLRDKKKVLRKIIDNEARIEVSDWISNEDEIFNVLSDSLELELQKKEISHMIFGFDRTSPMLDDIDFIQIESVKERISEIIMNEISHPDEGLAIAEEKIADAEYELELAESRRWLEFAQIQYQAENNLSFQRELSLGTSITIPNKNNNRVKKNDAALELLEKSYETMLKKEETEKETLLEQAKLMGLFDQHEAFIDMRKKQKLDSIYLSFAEKKLVSPLVLLDIKRAILKNAQKQLNFEKDIYESYIILLTQNAAFLNVPRKNFLKD